MIEWKGLRKKKCLRTLAMALVFCLFLTYPNVTEVLSVFATETQADDYTVYVSGFAELSEKVREQTVPVGTGVDELILPNTLDAFVPITEDEALTENVEETEAPTEATADETESPKTEAPTEATADETESPKTEEENVAADNEDNQTEESLTAESEASEEAALSENADNAEDIVENASSDHTENAELTQETSAAAQQENQSENTMAVEIIESTQEAAAKEDFVAIEGVTWQSEPEYDGNTEGTYIFTALLPNGYALMEDVSLPQITVTVQAESTDPAVQEIHESIAALFDPEAYLALEPDKSEEEAHAEWTEGLSICTEEALGIQEAYESLTEEQQAQISEEELAKLTAWLEIAENIDKKDDEIKLLMRPSEEDSSNVVYYLEESYDSYTWEVWNGEDWQEIGEYGAELLVTKEEWYTYRFRCVAKKGDTVCTACAEDDWQIEDMGISLLAASRDSETEQNEFMYYNTDTNYYKDYSTFDIQGIVDGNKIQTTFGNIGYKTASEVNGTKVGWTTPDRVSMGNSLYGSRELSLAFGRYVKIRYTVTNKGTSTQTFKIGSSADVKIGANDKAPVKGTDSGLLMKGILEDGTNDYEFNLVAHSADKLWYGYYGDAYKNIFNDLADKSTEYKEDSGMAWSWEGTVEPGKTWSKYVLLGVGDFPDTTPTITLDTLPTLYEGQQARISGKTEELGTAVIEINGEEFTGVADKNGNFSVYVTPPSDWREGETWLHYYAVSSNGGISTRDKAMTKLQKKPEISLTDTVTTVAEDDNTLTDTWYRSFIRSSNGTVNYKALTKEQLGKPDTYTITYTASKNNFSERPTKELKITVLPKPLELTIGDPQRVAGKNSYTLSATLTHTGIETINETGFVWGVMQNPTLTLNNGQKNTASPVTGKGGTLTVTAEDIAEGVNYYVRAYVKTSGGNVYYSSLNKEFSIGGKNYGKFSIRHNGNGVFYVERTGGEDEVQTVYFRTVNGSAIGGTHFDHQAGTLVFNQGEISKKITITEHAVTAIYGGDNATAYSNADRTYQVEIYRVDGGGTLGTTTKATRTMTKKSSYTVDRNCYVAKKEAVGNSDIVSKNTDVNSPSYATAFTMNRYYTSYVPYLKETADKYEMHLHVYVYEWENGWEWLRFTSGSQNAVAKFEIKPDENYRDWTNAWIPGKQGDTENEVKFSAYSGMNPLLSTVVNNTYAFGFNINTSPITVEVAASGGGPNDWTLGGCQQEAWYSDIKEPQIIGIAPMCGNTTYRVGDEITLSLVFDEIVDSGNSSLNASSTITTNWGNKLKYAGGVGTNVLYFTGTVPANATGTVKMKTLDCANQIKDMCSNTGGTTAGGSSGNTSMTVDTNVPVVSITEKSASNQTAKATISATPANTLQYTWTKNTTLPVKGWISAKTSGETVSNRITTGEYWYLHVLATYSATGKTTHNYAQFYISPPPSSGGGGSSTIVLPELEVSVNNSSDWAKAIPIAITKKTPSNATLTVKTPSSQSPVKVTGTTYNATANGTYIFTLKSGDETVVKSVTVTKIDSTAPGAVISGPAEKVQNENVTLTVTPSDTGGSGVKEVTAVWTQTPLNGATTTVNAEKKDNGDGTYSFTTPGAKGNQYNYTLKVTVTDEAGNSKTITDSNTYTVNLRVPTVTVKRTATDSRKGDTYSYTVDSKGNTIKSIQLPNGTTTTSLTGSFMLTAKGTYYVTVIDEAGHVVRSDAMIVSDVDGDAPDVRIYQQKTDWTNDDSVRLDVSIYDKSTIKSAKWQKNGSSSSTDISYTNQNQADSIHNGSFNITENGTYTVTVTDTAGNVGTASITVSNIDKAKPDVTCTVLGTKNSSGWYTNVPVNVKLAFSDNGSTGSTSSGIKSVEYLAVTSNTSKPTSGLKAPDAAALATRTYTYNITADAGCGQYYLYYKVTDKAGNVTEGFSDLIKVDSCEAAPVITGPAEGAAKLGMNISITYGPSGGKLYVVSGSGETKLAEMATVSDMNVEDSTKDDISYEITAEGTYTFRYDNKAFGEKSSEISVYKVAFDTQGGSIGGAGAAGLTVGAGSTGISGSGTGNTAAVIPPQLVWYDGTDGITCKVVKPEDPVRTGYTFGGWYTDENCTGDAFDFDNTQVKENITLYAKWEVNSYTVTYNLIYPDNSTYVPDESDAEYTYGEGLTLPVPEVDGYTFYGWYDNDDYLGDKYQEIGQTETGDKTYYGYYKDSQAPEITAALSNGEPGDGKMWYGEANRPTITVNYSDNAEIHKVQVKIDSGEYTDIAEAIGNQTLDYELTEGEHSYTFRAIDTTGNETETDTIKVKLDITKPVFGELTYENKAMDFLNWIIGKKSMIIHVPVTEDGSGAAQIAYTMTPVDPAGYLDEYGKTENTAEIQNGVATITFSDKFRGVIVITCTDAAGNISDSITVGENGVILENTAPVISSDVQDGYYYDNAPTLTVTVKDDEENAISAGIDTITYQVDDDAEKEVPIDKNAIRSEISFMIPDSELSMGEIYITVKAKDNAGNEAFKKIKVLVKVPEPEPSAIIDYKAEKLTGLNPGEEYTVNDTTYFADENGNIPFDEGWIGSTLNVVMIGNGTTTKDSAVQVIDVPKRPSAPPVLPQWAERTDSTVTLDTVYGAQYRIQGGEWQDSPTFTGLSEKTEYIFEISYPAEDYAFTSEISSATIITLPSTPKEEDSFEIDYENETFTLTDGVEAFTDEDCTILITSDSLEDYIGQDIYIRYAEDGKIPASEPQKIEIPSRPSAPAASTVNATYPEAQDGRITGLIEGIPYEIREKNDDDSWGEWTDAVLTGMEIRNLPAGEYEVRAKAVENGNFTGEATAVTVEETPSTVEDTPEIEIDYRQEMLTGFIPGDVYTITANGDTEIITVEADGTVKLKEEWIGATVSIVKSGNGTTIIDSEALTFDVPGRKAEAPSPIVVDPSRPSTPNGKLTGLVAYNNYQISTDGGETWKDVVADEYGEITDLAPGSYIVRVNGTFSEFSGKSSEVVVISAYSEQNYSEYSGGASQQPTPESTTQPASELTTSETTDPTEPSQPTETQENYTEPEIAEITEITENTEISSITEITDITEISEATEQPEQTTEPSDTAAPENADSSQPSQPSQPKEEITQTVQVSIDNGKLTISEETASTGNEAETSTTTGSSTTATTTTNTSTTTTKTAKTATTTLKAGDGTVTVKVVCEEEDYTAGVKDTVAVANAVLKPEQIQLVDEGENIQIRVDVKDISEAVPEQDKEVIDVGLTECRTEMSDMTLGTYVDISMFVKVGKSDWNAVTSTEEPIEVVVGIPEELQKDGREFYIIRSHDGEHTLLTDMDDDPNTITVESSLFSAYAIVYRQAEESAKCGLCHICPTFLGICYFIWLVIILAIIPIIWIIIRKKRKKQNEAEK